MGLIVLVCLFAWLIAPGNPTRMEFDALLKAPSAAHLFGTDQLGRDVFKMVLHGGRVSLFIGALSAAISAVIAVIYGAVAGLAPRWLDNALMRATELVMSVPSILYVVTIQAILGKPTPVSLALVIGITSWTSIAKIVRTEVRQIHGSEYILSARLSGAKFGYVLRKHLLPNVLPSVMFMLIYNVSTAIAAEASLSFLGLGLPPNSASWGALMSTAQDALLTNSWWLILIPTTLLVTTLICITNIGEWLRRR
jgi:peptide/nickel transport system permease protein